MGAGEVGCEFCTWLVAASFMCACGGWDGDISGNILIDLVRLTIDREVQRRKG
jgi:hypothetical protein